MPKPRNTVPVTTVQIAHERLDLARKLAASVLKHSVSCGVRRALAIVRHDPRKALAWVIRRYGDPIAPTSADIPQFWQTGVYNGGFNMAGTPVSGLTLELRAYAAAFGYGPVSRGVSFAIDYAVLCEAHPEPEYINGAASYPAPYRVWTLDQHVEAFHRSAAVKLEELRSRVRPPASKQTPEDAYRRMFNLAGPSQAGVTVQPSLSPCPPYPIDTGWLDAEPSTSADSTETGE